MADEKKVVRIFLQKNDLTENAKLPYFNLVLIPEEEGGEWVKIGALWKSKSGKGYNGQLNEGVVLDASKMVEFKKEKAAQAEKADKEFEGETEAKNED